MHHQGDLNWNCIRTVVNFSVFAVTKISSTKGQSEVKSKSVSAKLKQVSIDQGKGELLETQIVLL